MSAQAKQLYMKRYGKKRSAPIRPVLKKKIASLTRKVRNAEAPYLTYSDNNANKDIYDTATVEALDVAASLPSTVPTTKSLLKTLKVSGQVKLTTASADTEIARIVIVLDRRKFDNNVAPVWGDVFQQENVYSLRKDTSIIDRNKSFTVLFDRTITLNNDSASLSNLKLFKYTKHFKNSMEQYNYAEYCQNLIYLMYVSTSATTEMDLSFQNSVTMSRE